MLAQKNKGKEQAIYYLSRTFVDYETRYIHLKKLYLTVIFATKKLRYYMLNNTTYVIAKEDPLKYMMNKTYHNVRTSKWIMYLTEFDLHFISQKSIKGKVIVDYLAEAPIEDDKSLSIELPDESIFLVDEEKILLDLEDDWEMMIYFDGSQREKENGVGVIFVTPQGMPIPYSFKLNFVCINNRAEYETLILALKIMTEMGVTKIKLIDDFVLIVNQIKGVC